MGRFFETTEDLFFMTAFIAKAMPAETLLPDSWRKVDLYRSWSLEGRPRTIRE